MRMSSVESAQRPPACQIDATWSGGDGHRRMLKWVVRAILLVATILAQATGDLDGDGRPETARVLPDGRVQVVSADATPLGEAVLEGAAGHLVFARVAIHTVDGHRVLEVRGTPRGHAFETALVAEVRDGALRALWSGTLGPQGRDAEWSRHLEVTGDAILLFERSPRVTRCDGEPVRLLPRAWDFIE